jgi:MFS transporter, DHA2 family, multidrug resistance protein
VLLSGYRSQLSLGHLPPVAASAVRSSVAGGVAVAHATHSADLLVMVRTAYVHGQDIMLVVCAVIALASAVLALIFLPRRRAAVTAVPADPGVPTAPALSAAADGTARPVATGPSSGENHGS